MKVGILLITHDGIGAAIYGTAEFMIKGCPAPVKLLSANRESDPEALLEDSVQLIRELDQGAGVLVLTDLFGSTPSNIARRLHQYARVKIVSGLNLPMLIRVFNYADLDLEALSTKAHSGGQDGVTLDHGQPP